MNDAILSTASRPERLIARGVEVLRIESAAIAALEARIGESFARACALILACRGRVVVSGIGKSGHVGRKIAATLASTGTPAFFVHPTEASHGDLGMITPDDVFLALSNSGATDELLAIVAATHSTVVMVTHDVDEAVLLSDKIVMMTNGPAATIGEVLPVELPRPRSRVALADDPHYQSCRKAVIDFLYTRQAHTEKL